MLFAFFGVGPMEMVIVGGIAVMLFGGRLPRPDGDRVHRFLQF